MGNGDVFQSDVELLSTLQKVCSYSVADSFTLGNELSSIKLCDYGFQDLIAN